VEPAIVTLLATLATTFVLCLALLFESRSWNKGKTTKTGEKRSQSFLLIVALLAITPVTIAIPSQMEVWVKTPNYPAFPNSSWVAIDLNPLFSKK